MSQIKLTAAAGAALVVVVGAWAHGQIAPVQSAPAVRKHIVDMQRVALLGSRIEVIQAHANKLAGDQADLLAELNGPHETRHRRRVALLAGLMKERIADIREQVEAIEQELETLDQADLNGVETGTAPKGEADSKPEEIPASKTSIPTKK